MAGEGARKNANGSNVRHIPYGVKKTKDCRIPKHKRQPLAPQSADANNQGSIDTANDLDAQLEMETSKGHGKQTTKEDSAMTSMNLECGTSLTVNHFLTPGDVLLKKGDSADDRAVKYEQKMENPENSNLALVGEDVPRNPMRFVTIFKNTDDDMFPMVCKKSNTSFPYKKYIKFVKTDGWNTTTEILEYNKKLHEAYKYLLYQLFAGRSDCVHVYTLKIRRLDPIMVLRLQENVKFKIGRLIESGERAIGNRVETLKQFTY